MVTLSPAPTSYTASINDSTTFISSLLDCNALAIILNIEFVSGARIKVLDKLNNTNMADSLPDLSKIPRISNEIFLLTTSIFLFINYDAFETAIENDASRRDESRAFRAFISSFLILVATSITSGNLEV